LELIIKTRKLPGKKKPREKILGGGKWGAHKLDFCHLLAPSTKKPSKYFLFFTKTPVGGGKKLTLSPMGQ